MADKHADTTGKSPEEQYKAGLALPRFSSFNRPLTLWEKLYIGPISKGMGLTIRHFLENFLFKKRYVVSQYPEERMPVSARWRGTHRLTWRTEPDVRMTCVACKMCEMACPANCITIVAGELDPPYYTNRQRIDKYPVVFDIDLAKCIYCGLCVEACPEDAIRMDTGAISSVSFTRKEQIMHRDDLLNLEPTKHEIQWREHSYPPEDLLPNIRERYMGTVFTPVGSKKSDTSE